MNTTLTQNNSGLTINTQPILSNPKADPYTTALLLVALGDSDFTTPVAVTECCYEGKHYDVDYYDERTSTFIKVIRSLDDVKHGRCIPFCDCLPHLILIIDEFQAGCGRCDYCRHPGSGLCESVRLAASILNAHVQFGTALISPERLDKWPPKFDEQKDRSADCDEDEQITCPGMCDTLRTSVP